MAMMPRNTDAPPGQAAAGGYPPTLEQPVTLDWSRATVGDPAPCVVCRRSTLLRHPETGRPHHKVCSPPRTRAAVAAKTEILPCRFCGEPASLQGPEGKPEHWSCRRQQESRA